MAQPHCLHVHIDILQLNMFKLTYGLIGESTINCRIKWHLSVFIIFLTAIGQKHRDQPACYKSSSAIAATS